MKTIAFIPARGGSQSIPRKNIKPLCGKPLIYWTVAALAGAAAIDEIIVATDDDEIAAVVAAFGFPQTKIYRRRPENATATASTESVMLEYLEQSDLADDDIFILAQATAPLTQTRDFVGALQWRQEKAFDSLISCVRDYRFFWNEDGSAKNYDYRARPRRQDFGGQLMENGAFYIYTVGGIKRDHNRLGGKIGIYEMPAWTAPEIDESDDWIILEQLMRKYVCPAPRGKIKLFLSDVDGVLTDGGMYYSENGDELKKFNTRDGIAFELLRAAGIKVGIITSENRELVARRAQKLRLDYAVQGARDGGKLAAAQKICAELGITLAETAFVGDEINDRELLGTVGHPFCPRDAAPEIKSIDGITVVERNGGEGVIRAITEML
ncbi:acylneuraminate cytidylyltransferase [Planctomycetales bacterium]|nr:acylneuraminate cytidylyltransferase [Planctomycetales bacterium]GHT01145.1 acylneuraminate cytidylyltransferase [Planctomycetales bacterium]GHT03222.1 acylneuraminate cytidylyltransferase [Planctomycetales bacterium]